MSEDGDAFNDDLNDIHWCVRSAGSIEVDNRIYESLDDIDAPRFSELAGQFVLFDSLEVEGTGSEHDPQPDYRILYARDPSDLLQRIQRSLAGDGITDGPSSGIPPRPNRVIQLEDRNGER